MELIISKELLSEVLGEKICIEDTRPYMQYSDLCYDIYENEISTKSINIHELAHKCKEWAFDNGYYLTIYNDAVDIILQTNCKLIENITDDSFKYSPMLVFKACQWILDQRTNKCTE